MKLSKDRLKELIKNPEVMQHVNAVEMYGNLILNDVPVDGNGNVVVKKEKERTDNKLQRSYYNATFLSMENLGLGRTVTMWQSLSSDEKSLVWKNAINPVIAGKMIGGQTSGFICPIKLNSEYDVPRVGGGFTTTNKTTLFVPHEDKLEDVIKDFLIQNKIIVPVVAENEDTGAGLNIATGANENVKTETEVGAEA